MLLGVPKLVNFGPGGVCSCNGVTCSFAVPLGWRHQYQGTFVPWDTPWGDFAPVPANRCQPSWEHPGSCREWLGRGMDWAGGCGHSQG